MIELRLSPDGQGGEVVFESGHSVRIPLDHRAGAMLEGILHAQETGASGLGTKGKPLQSMVDEYLRKGGRVLRIEPIGKAKSTAKVDISLEELFDGLE